MNALLKASAAAIIVAGMTGTAMIGPASAADLARRPPPPMVTKAPPPPAYVPYSWAGFYLGVNGGYGFGKSDWDGLGERFDAKGGLAGGQVGYNWQFGQFVYGIEGDADWADLHGTGSFGERTKTNFLSTVRGRAGIAMDRWLPYATGGLAIGKIRADVPGLAGGVDETNTGWTAGGGLEFALGGNWTAKAEYLYVDLGNVGCGVQCGLPAGNDVSLTSHVVRGGVNYRF